MDYTKISSVLDDLLGKTDLSSTSSEGSKPSDLPDGFFLCEVEAAELTESKAGNPMVSFQFKVVEDGLKSIVDDAGNATLVLAKGTVNRKLWINYTLTTEQNVNFFVSDMLKFEEPGTRGKPLLADTVEEAKLFFKSTELLIQALDVIATGSRIYVMVQSKTKPGTDEIQKKYSLISWTRAERLHLPM